jgi:hypothetical protein
MKILWNVYLWISVGKVVLLSLPIYVSHCHTDVEENVEDGEIEDEGIRI